MKESDLSIGEKVTWTKMRPLSHGRLSLSLREGKVVKVSGEMITVSLRGREQTIHRSCLRKSGETTELTEFALGLGEKSLKD